MSPHAQAGRLPRGLYGRFACGSFDDSPLQEPRDPRRGRLRLLAGVCSRRQQVRMQFDDRKCLVERPASASSPDLIEWHGIDWARVNRNVRNLQIRIAKATKERDWRKVKALQR